MNSLDRYQTVLNGTRPDILPQVPILMTVHIGHHCSIELLEDETGDFLGFGEIKIDGGALTLQLVPHPWKGKGTTPSVEPWERKPRASVSRHIQPTG